MKSDMQPWQEPIAEGADDEELDQIRARLANVRS
jgi:hypothetical protein